MAFENREQATRYRVQDGDTLESLAARVGTTWQELALYNFGTDDRNKVDQHLTEDVGCTRRDASGHFVFSSADDPGIMLLPQVFQRRGLPINQTHVLRIRPPEEDQLLLTCASIPGVTFAFDSSFIRPNVVDHLQRLELAVQRYPNAKIIVYGHTDRVGRDQYNKDLSDRRAKSAYAFVVNKPELWEELYNDEKWGLWAVQEVLRALGHDPGTSDGVMGPNTQRAMRSFLGITDESVNVPNDEAFRLRLFGAYMDGLFDVEVNESRFISPKFMGCGEFNPMFDANRPEQENRRPGNEANRRVIFFFFSRPPRDIPCELSNVAPCRTEMDKPGPRRKPLNRCAFFDRISARCQEEAAQPRLGQPTLFHPEQPGAPNEVRMNRLFAYMVHYEGDSDNIEQVQLFRVQDGKLTNPASGNPVDVETDRIASFYFSHRDDLRSRDVAARFARRNPRLPLLGPMMVPGGPVARLVIDIWQQNDWAIVRGPRVNGTRPDGVRMGEWREDYNTGQLLKFRDQPGHGFFPFGDHREKEKQERWNGRTGAAEPIDLIHLGNPGGNPMWVGTLSELPSDRAKLLVVHRHGGGELFATSYNAIQHTSRNQDFPGHHRYNQSLVQQLLAVPRNKQPNAEVDALPAPPSRALLPGNICWANQGQTNNCGAFSFAAAMNYWEPYTSNPARMDGATYARPGNVDDLINGARTPANIVTAAGRFRMTARDNDAESLDRARALKLLRLWLHAGVPVLILVEEEYNVWSLHWKCVVGYAGSRFFYNNSGADHEVVRANRTPGIDYEHAPVGNDVDSEAAAYAKWKSAGGDVVDLITSVDECTFIPIVPRDAMYAGTQPV